MSTRPPYRTPYNWQDPNLPRTREIQFLNAFDTTTILAYLKTNPSNPKIEIDDTGSPFAYPVWLFDPANMRSIGSLNPLPTTIADPTTPTQKVLLQLGGAYFGVGQWLLPVAAEMMLYAPALNRVEPKRTPSVWKSALISGAGSTAIWTSGVGAKWRLMGMQATLVNGTTAAAASLLKILDVAADTGIGVQICGAALGAVGTSSIIFNASWENGILAAATNTALNVNLSSALAVAGVFVQVWGTEE